MRDPESVSAWLDRLKDGDSLIQHKIWERYREQLVAYARRKLAAGKRRVADEEDVAVSAFESLCRGAERGAFAKLEDRDDLWQLLMMLSARKARRQIQSERRAKRGSGKVRGESVMDGIELSRGIEQFAEESVPPDFATLLEDQLAQLMQVTGDDALRTIAMLKMEGYSNKEIAEQTGRALRSIERKLKLIRDIWSATD